MEINESKAIVLYLLNEVSVLSVAILNLAQARVEVGTRGTRYGTGDYCWLCLRARLLAAWWFSFCFFWLSIWVGK